MILSVCPAETFIDAKQCIQQKCRCRPLFRTASDFFIVKNTMYRDTVSILCCQKCLQGCKCALQIIQLADGHEFLICSPDASSHPVIQEQVIAHNILCTYSGRLCNLLHKSSLFTSHSIERKQILLRIVFITIIGFPVHMDCQIRNHHKVPVHRYQLRHQTTAFPHHQSSRHRKRSVKPWCTEHPAITLHIQLHILSFHFHLRMFLDLKRRGITVTCHNLKSPEIFLRDPKCQNRRSVSGHIISAAFL